MSTLSEVIEIMIDSIRIATLQPVRSHRRNQILNSEAVLEQSKDRSIRLPN